MCKNFKFDILTLFMIEFIGPKFSTYYLPNLQIRSQTDAFIVVKG